MRIEPLENRIAPAALLVTNLNDSGDGSLRDAITKANADADADTITIKTKLAGTITLKSDLADITSDISIVGNNKVTISGAGKYQILDVEGSGLDVAVTKLTLSKGLAANGAGLLVNDVGGTVSLTKVIISSSTATGSGGAVQVNAGTLEVVKGAFIGNKAGGAGGAIDNGVSGTISLTNSRVTLNNAGLASDGTSSGGGIYNAGSLTLTDSTISTNTAKSDVGAMAQGGGIFNTQTGTADLVRSIVSGNQAVGGKGDNGVAGSVGAKGDNGDVAVAGYAGENGYDGSYGTAGGGANGGGVANFGTLTLKSTTVSGNSVLGGKGGNGGAGGDGGKGGKGGDGYSYGGYLYAPGMGGSGGAGGNGGAGGDAGAAQGGGIYNGHGTVTVKTSTISGNTAVAGTAGVGGKAGKGGAIGATGTPATGTGGTGGTGGGYYYGAPAGHGVTVSKSKTSGATTKAAGDSLYDPTPGANGVDGADGAAAGSMGGGLFSTEGTVVLSQATIGGNVAKTQGGGVWIGDSVVTTIHNSTITANTSALGGGLAVTGSSSVPVAVVSSIIAGNKAATDADVNGTFLADYSLIQAVGSASITGANNIFDVSAKLGSLDLHGGLTATYLPSKKSAAVDAGFNIDSLDTDQRGKLLPIDGKIDIGATEVA